MLSARPKKKCLQAEEDCSSSKYVIFFKIRSRELSSSGKGCQSIKMFKYLYILTYLWLFFLLLSLLKASMVLELHVYLPRYDEECGLQRTVLVQRLLATLQLHSALRQRRWPRDAQREGAGSNGVSATRTQRSERLRRNSIRAVDDRALDLRHGCGSTIGPSCRIRTLLPS